MPSAKTRPSAPLLQLKMQQNPDGQVDATIPVKWCVQPALIQELKEAGFVDPHLLLVVRHTIKEPITPEYTRVSWKDTSRYFVPIGREMQYVSFSRPGINQVVAVIVDRSRIMMGFYDFVFNKSSQGYGQDVLYEDGSAEYMLRDKVPTLDVSSIIQVEVPKEMFAPEPTAWRKTLVNRYFTTKPFDQCHFRRRFIISLAWTPIFMVIGTIFKLLSLVLALAVGLRNPAIGHLFRPLKGEWAGIWTNSNQTSFWLHQRKKEHEYSYGYDYYSFPRIVMNPFAVFIPPAVVFWIGQAQYHTGTGESEVKKHILDWGWWKTFSVVVAIELVLFLSIMVVMLTVNVIGGLRKSNKAQLRHQKHEKLKKQNQQRRNVTHQEVVLRELEAMVCNKSTDEVSIDTLRKDKQTIRLRFAHIKSRVCRPYAN